MIRLIPCLLAVFVLGDALYAGGDEARERRVMVVRKTDQGPHGDREAKLHEIRKRLEKVNKELAELRAMMHGGRRELHVTPQLRFAKPTKKGHPRQFELELDIDVCRECDGDCQCHAKKKKSQYRIERRRVMQAGPAAGGIVVLEEAEGHGRRKAMKKKTEHRVMLGGPAMGGFAPAGGPGEGIAKLKELHTKQKHYAAAARKDLEKGNYEAAAKHAHLAATTGKAIEAAKKVMAARAQAARRRGPGPGGPSFGAGSQHPMEARMTRVEQRLDRIEGLLKRLVAEKKKRAR